MYRISILILAAFLVACGNDPDLLSVDPLAPTPGALETWNKAGGSNGKGQQRPEDRFAWVMLTWESAPTDTAVNLDLHVLDPAGNEINLTRTTSRDHVGRFLEHPECTSYDCRGDERVPRETIYWSLDGLSPGEYTAWVQNISDGSSSFDLQIVFGDHRVNESASVSGGQQSNQWKWTVDAEPTGECLSQLRQLGAQFDSTTISEGSCTVEDGVMIRSPLNGVTYKVHTSRSTTRFRTSCETAVALHKYGGVMTSKGITEVYHDGSFSCRNINGTNTSSTHSYARAMDFIGFGGNGTTYSVLDDWTKGSDAKRQMLRDLADGGRRFFTTVLTPDSNADHADHFHMDLGR